MKPRRNEENQVHIGLSSHRRRRRKKERKNAFISGFYRDIDEICALLI
jgi:hypothetical protein